MTLFVDAEHTLVEPIRGRRETLARPRPAALTAPARRPLAPHLRDRRETPAVRLARIADIPRRASPGRHIVLEGTAFPGNSGSPIILKPVRDAGRDQDDDLGGKLIGILCRIGNTATLVRSDEDGLTVEFKETSNLIMLAPVDALRTLLRDAIADIILAETFGLMWRRVRGWVRGRGHADWNRAMTRAVQAVLAEALRLDLQARAETAAARHLSSCCFRVVRAGGNSPT